MNKHEYKSWSSMIRTNTSMIHVHEQAWSSHVTSTSKKQVQDMHVTSTSMLQVLHVQVQATHS